MTGKSYVKWMNDVRTFFKNYNDLKDVEEEANILLDSYPKEFVNLRFLSLEFKIEYILIYVIVFVLAVILFKKIRRRIKIIKRNLRRMRNKRKKRK